MSTTHDDLITRALEGANENDLDGHHATATLLRELAAALAAVRAAAQPADPPSLGREMADGLRGYVEHVERGGDPHQYPPAETRKDGE